MPSAHPTLVALRGDAAYQRYLDRLMKAVRAGGTPIVTRHQFAEHALVVLGLQHGLKAPARVSEHGGKRTPR